MIDFKRLKQSFTHALRGVVVVFQSEQSFRLQIFGALLIILFGIWLRIRTWEWIILLGLIGSVLCLEMVNSVFERIIDTFKPRIHPIVRDIKDIMAATVLTMSSIALLVGVLIFWPYVLVFIR
ncbi:MAG: diacylglycerol kinase [Patescibacteria group bacterium]|mgnify:CR=1 FL=1